MQASGGLFTDWEPTAASWAEIGYPFVEVEADGSFTVAKPERTGGLVSVGTVAEQLVYEIGDPGAYQLPDVACDFTQVRVAQAAAERVRPSRYPALHASAHHGAWFACRCAWRRRRRTGCG